MNAADILARLGFPFKACDSAITQLKRKEDGEPYRVWKMKTGEKTYILKKAKEYEAEVYKTILKGVTKYVPAVFGIGDVDGDTYILMEYVEGNDLRRCTREALTAALDALTSLQNAFWNDKTHINDGYTFDMSITGRENRRKYLLDQELEAAYDKFLAVYKATPRTLCHDDLLPFNVITDGKRAVLIDWEYGGILPYPVSFARLFAHGDDDPNAFFYMTGSDREFAIEYYYDKLLAGKGISYTEWTNTLEYFLFYEYCEWVMVGNKYGATDGENFGKYLPLAKKQAKKILGNF